jgi:hypothetical protein
VISIVIVKEKKNTVRINWDPLCLGEDDEPETVDSFFRCNEIKIPPNLVYGINIFLVRCK